LDIGYSVLDIGYSTALRDPARRDRIFGFTRNFQLMARLF